LKAANQKLNNFNCDPQKTLDIIMNPIDLLLHPIDLKSRESVMKGDSLKEI